MRQVLGELTAEAQFTLRHEPRLQVVIVDDAIEHGIWAHFPVPLKRWMAVTGFLAHRAVPTTAPSARILR